MTLVSRRASPPLFVQADNNDTYEVQVSDDGELWFPAWTVPVDDGEGLRARYTDDVDARGRYLRIGLANGDGAFSIGEIQAFCQRPVVWPPKLPVDLERQTRLSLAKIALGLIAIAAFCVPRNRISASRQRIMYGSLLAASAFTWVNFASFHGPRAVHLWDSMHYYVGSKYFEETRYHLLYSCIAVAEADDGRRADVLSHQYRDLSTNRLAYGAWALSHEPDCRAAFSPPRWRAFQQDVRLFRSLMGPGWFRESVTDHGYNAAPLWTLIGRMFSNWNWEAHVPPPELVNRPDTAGTQERVDRAAATARFVEDRSRLESSLARLAWIDAFLYASIFALIGWSFGLRTAALAAVFWAVGHPWAYYWTGGGFARIPWLFSAVASVCLLEKNRPVAAGCFLAWSALLRAFPAVLIAGIALKLGWRFGTPARFLAGFVGALAVLIPLSDIDAYPEFFENSARHQATPLTNHMGLPVLAAWHPDDAARETIREDETEPFSRWKELRRERLTQRRWVYVFLVAGLLVLFIPGARALQPAQSVTLGVVLAFALFELTSYYYIFLLLLAPVAAAQSRRVVAMLALAISTQIAALRVDWFDALFTLDTLLVLGLLVYVLVDVIRTEGRTAASRPTS